MDDDELQRIIDEEFKLFEEVTPPIMKQIMDIFEKSDLPVHTTYLILKRMQIAFEDSDPSIKYASTMAKIKDTKSEYSISFVKNMQKIIHMRWNKGHKATVLIASLRKSPSHPKDSKKVKCHECKKDCYYSTDDIDLTIKDIKIICPKCILDPKKKYRKETNEEQRFMLLTAYPELKTKDEETYFTFTRK